MKANKMVGKGWAKAILLALLFLVFGTLIFPFGGGMSVVKAEVEDVNPPCVVEYYQVNAVVNQDRTIDFEEEIKFTISPTFNDRENDTFYRALPLEGDRYLNIEAEGVDNPKFSYHVAENPDEDGFLDINCKGGVKAGATLTYRFRYKMEVNSSNTDNGMIIDFVGAGWPFALRNVSLNVQFPAALTDVEIHSNRFGSSGNLYAEVVEQTDTTLSLFAKELPLERSNYEYSAFAIPITIDFELEKGALNAGARSDFASPTVWIPFAVGLAFVVAAVLLLLVSMKKPILSTVVGFKAPNGMDPMELGYVLDGIIDTEDVTSMIYYFASKGYLSISMDGDNPVLTRRCKELPETESDHAKAIFRGVFDDGREVTHVDDLKSRFFIHSDRAKTLVGKKRQAMYQGRSIARFIGCALLAVGVFALVPMIVGLAYIGGGYVPGVGFLMFLPVGLTAVFAWLLENYRYKWTKKKQSVLWIVQAFAMVVGILIYQFTLTHVLTGLERWVTLAFGYAVMLIGTKMLVRKEAYVETLGKILGFREFILVTKKDRLEAMLETNPELFYDVLPYAQVMGVSDVWEEKFKTIEIRPPSWYDGDFTLFDFWILNSAMRSMNLAMLVRPSDGGKSVGGIGGGGFFGGFSGGGGGGGGGGFR